MNVTHIDHTVTVEAALTASVQEPTVMEFSFLFVYGLIELAGNMWLQGLLSFFVCFIKHIQRVGMADAQVFKHANIKEILLRQTAHEDKNVFSDWINPFYSGTCQMSVDIYDAPVHSEFSAPQVMPPVA